ncbi:MAG: hypothetical protein IKT58_01205 [Oscillospiraceae bacterium]|nr:hypothetical protein [Oscillospiraceae bacterium]
MNEKVQTLMKKAGIKKSITLPQVIAFIGILVMLLSLCMPFSVAQSEYKELLLDEPSDWFLEEEKITRRDAAKLSVIEFCKIFSSEEAHLIDDDDAEIMSIFFGAIVFFTVLAAAFVLLKKPILSIIFALLTWIDFGIINICFKEIKFERLYKYGSAKTFAILGIIAICIGAFLMRADIKQEKIDAAKK